MIRWLHISDLHIKDRADWINFQKELMSKCQKVGKIDLVIVTGDFHDFSDGNDFHLAKEFLQTLISQLNLDISKDLFIIPGNHDGVTNIKLKSTYIPAARNQPVALQALWLDELLKMFEDYEAFVREMIPDYPVDHPAQVHARVWKNKINFIHCNTAIGSDGKQKSNQLLDIEKLASAFYSKDMPNIILAHNSFFDINIDQQKRMRDVIRNNSVRAYFCGDRHIEGVEQISYEDNQNKQIPCVVSYKSAPDAMDEYSVFGVIIGEWNQRMAALKGWIWRSGEGFNLDPVITEKEIDMGRGVDEQDGDSVLDNLVCKDEINNMEIDDKYIKIQTYERKRDFIKLFHNMTPCQLELFNKKYGSCEPNLRKGGTSSALFDFVEAAEGMRLLDDMLNYIISLF